MIFSLFNPAISPEEAVHLLQQIFDPSISKGIKEKAIKRFDNTYRSKIKKWALQFGMPKLEAEELFNEIYLDLPKLTENLRKKPILQFDAYLKRVVKNKVCTYFNKVVKKPPPFELTEEDLITRADMNESALHYLYKVEQTLIVKAALESPDLSEKDSQLITDFYYAKTNITLKKIAEQNGETEEAVRLRKLRCLQKLKAILLKMGFKDADLLDEGF